MYIPVSFIKRCGKSTMKPPLGGSSGG